jgi:hypothetical protein
MGGGKFSILGGNNIGGCKNMFGMITEIELFESPDPSPLDFCLRGWIKSEVYKRKVDTPDELLACILDTAARIKKREDQLTLALRKRDSRGL